MVKATRSSCSGKKNGAAVKFKRSVPIKSKVRSSLLVRVSMFICFHVSFYVYFYYISIFVIIFAYSCILPLFRIYFYVVSYVHVMSYCNFPHPFLYTFPSPIRRKKKSAGMILEDSVVILLVFLRRAGGALFALK